VSDVKLQGGESRLEIFRPERLQALELPFGTAPRLRVVRQKYS